ncbi:hypothetical protein F5Y13DRAFT_181956 [Hypoxylon sp. FL1857]|nr:hypothetical protein F5Y13DRAFT_181956 [Hypoxylon sp. FL1857]
MEISLDCAEEVDFTALERAIFNVLKATLQYPGNPHAKTEKLANDIIFFCESSLEAVNVSEVLWDTWSVIVEIIFCVPPDHPWQDCIIGCLSSLRNRDDAIPKHDRSSLWADLPNLSLCIREKWIDPTYTGEESKEEFDKWENLNSFVARVTSTGFAPWLNFPIWQLRMALEEPPLKGPAMSCRLWVASEWIIHCANLIFEEIGSTNEPDESTARALGPGPLYDGKEILGRERWEFWKRKFSELNNEAGKLELDTAIAKRIGETVKVMDAITK